MTDWPGWQGQADPGGVVLAVARVPVQSSQPGEAAPSPQAWDSPRASAQPAGTGSADDVVQAITLRVAILALAAAVLAAIAGAVAADRLVRPLRRLETAAAAVSDGDLERRSGLAGRRDEIGDLARAFDRMADTLATSEATQRRFLQDAIHELRTPLTVIEATTSAIIDGVYEPEPRHLATIRGQARVLSRIIDELRTISLAEGRGLDLRPEPVEVASTLRRVAEGFRARGEEAQIAIEVDAPEALVVVADPERLRQMLGSLVDNAMRHTPAGGAITLAGSAEAGPAVRLHVRDTGTGVAAEDQPHVFERFYQADASRDRARGASGLGLAIVKAITEAMGGRVGVASTPARGADFWIELPSA